MKGKRDGRLSRKARILLTAGIVAAVLLGAWFGVQAWLGHKVTQLLESAPLNLDGSAYVADVRKTRVDMARRSVTLYGVSIRTQKHSHNRRNGPVPVLEASAARISASGVHFRRERDTLPAGLRIRNIEVESPEILFEGIPGSGCDTCRTETTGKKLDMAIDRLAVRNATVHAGLWAGDEKNTFSVEGLDLTLRGIALDGTPAPDTLRTEQAARQAVASARLSVRNCSYAFKNGALKIEADTLSADTEAGTLSVERLALLPQYDKYQYSLRVGDHTDWVLLDVKDVAGTGVRFPYLSGEQTFRADSVGVGCVEIDSYKDRNQPQSPAFRQMLYTSVQRIPLGIDIPVIDAHNINIRYEEVSKGASVPGVVRFTDMNARVTGLTNQPREEAQQYRIYAEGYLFGGAPVTTVLSLPADSLNDRFSLRAVAGPMSATLASPVTEPIANVRIVSGDIHSVRVELSGNSLRAQSVVDMRYDDLQIAILRKNDPDRERELLTTIANGMVLHRNNPQDGKLRIGHGAFERDPQKSFWNYLWKTSFAGVSDIVM